MNALDQSALEAHVVIVSDHGYHMGEKSHWRKFTFWDQTLRVPLIISSPDYPPGEVTKPTTLLDIAPTIFAMADIPDNQIPSQFVGMPLLNSTTPVQVYHAGGKAIVRTRQGNDWKHIDYDVDTANPDDESAYNLSIDPTETINRIVEYRALPGC